MTNTKITADSFLDNKELREEAMARVEVLDKVKKIVLIPELECMTVKQVADYFEVEFETVKWQYKNNKDEFDGDGVHTKKPSDMKSLSGSQTPTLKTAQRHGFLEITLSDNTTVAIPNCGVKCFPKRAVLRMGMLLRDSAIAAEVRTQILNGYEKLTPEQQTAEIDKEEDLVGSIIKSALKGETQNVLTTFTDYIGYKNRYIAKIEQHNAELAQENAKISEEKEKVEEINKGLSTTNAALVKEQNTWEPRPIINALVKTYARSRYPWQQNKYAKAWDDFYYNLKYKYHIDIVSRHIRNNKIGGKIAYIRHNEFDRAIKVAVAMCEQRGIDTGKIINEVNSEAAKSTDKAGVC